MFSGWLTGWSARLLARRLLQMAATMCDGAWSRIIDDGGDEGDGYNRHNEWAATKTMTTKTATKKTTNKH